MKPLLYIMTALCLVSRSFGAPQPLVSLSTTSEIDKLTTVLTSDANLSSVEEKVTTVPTVGEKSTSGAIEIVSPKDALIVDIRNIPESVLSREYAESNVGEASKEIILTSTIPDETVSRDFIENTKLPENNSTEVVDPISKPEVTISRYIPPLDPLKHMLMMDIHNIPKVNIIEEKTGNSIPITSTSTPLSADTTRKEEYVSTGGPGVDEKVVAESSVEEKLQPLTTDSIIIETTTDEILKKSEELLAETELDNKPINDARNTESSLSPSTTTPNNISSDVPTTESVENVEETMAIFKNSEEILKTEDSTTRREISSEKELTTPVALTTIEESSIVEHSTSSEVLLKSAQELKSETSTSERETMTTTNPTATEEIPEKDNINETSVWTLVSKHALSTTTTTVVPETTLESRTTLASSEGRRNISLDEELEFREAKVPLLNASKVTYVKRRPTTTENPDVVELASISVQDTEATSPSILTTIADILFSSSSTTEVSETVPTESQTETTAHVTDRTLLLSVEKAETSDLKADSGAVLSSNEADMIRIQPLEAELDTVPAEEETTTTVKPSKASLIAENRTDVYVSEESVETPNPEYTDDSPEGTSEFIPETTKESPATTEKSTSPEAESTTASTTTVSESKPEEPEEIDRVETSPIVQNDPELPKTNHSDYLLNIKNKYVSGENTDMVAAVQFLHYHDKASSEQCYKLVNAHWNYATNLTEENKKKQLEQTLRYSLFHKEAWKNATSFAWKSFNDTLLRRWFKSLSVLGTSALPEEKLNELNRIKAEMKNSYSTAKICTYVSPEGIRKGQILREKDCSLTLEPDLQKILTKSRDYDELVHVWKAWRDAAGKPIREKYLRFVNLSNEAARLNGFIDTGDMWKEAYESDTFETDLEQLWEQVKPLYQNLHAYVRRKLINHYGADKIKENGPIPAHLFGNMWAQSWISLLDITQPFSGKPSVDVTPIMEAKNMTAYEMFKISEEFFTSLGLKPMPDPFWKHSLIEKPKDREIICHASAWDFCNGRDYRIKQCTDITMEDLITVHHEMGHIQYFLQYARQPNVFREGANPGFHEAIGDVLALSVSTPKHLKSIGLLDHVADDPEGDLNFLLYTALDKVSFLPSGYLIDLWRWGLFSGDIKPEEMNTKWWDLRLKYQGVCPPVKRTDTDFDPGAKFHVPGNVPYIRYFVSFVIQFQFHKVLCDASGHTGPLYKCDIYKSREAGQILSQVMELGSSEHWSEAMKIMTGGSSNKMDAGPILEYFEPLLEYLKEQNINETLGWESDDSTICP